MFGLFYFFQFALIVVFFSVHLSNFVIAIYWFYFELSIHFLVKIRLWYDNFPINGS